MVGARDGRNCDLLGNLGSAFEQRGAKAQEESSRSGGASMISLVLWMAMGRIGKEREG